MKEKAPEGSTQTETPTPRPAVSISGHSTATPGTPSPDENTGGNSNGRSQYKPLKHWKSGECYRGGEEKRGRTFEGFATLQILWRKFSHWQISGSELVGIAITYLFSRDASG